MKKVKEIKSGNMSQIQGDLSEYLLLKARIIYWMKWPAHVEIMDEDRLQRVANMHEENRRRRPCFRWVDCTTKADYEDWMTEAQDSSKTAEEGHAQGDGIVKQP